MLIQKIISPFLDLDFFSLKNSLMSDQSKWEKALYILKTDLRTLKMRPHQSNQRRVSIMTELIKALT